MAPISPHGAPPLIGFIGAGNMARSLVSGLLKNGWGKNQIILSDPDSSQRKSIESVLGVKTSANNQDVVTHANILVLAVKPQVLAEVAMELATAVQKKKPLVISIAAGVRLADLDRWLGGGLAIVRSMPNTAALIGSGAAGLFANARVNEAMRNQAESILRAVGVTVWLNDESLMDVVTALSGSGPAYFFLIMEALEQASIESGLDAKQARLLTLETAYGAAKMALEGHEEPSQLRRRVTSPGGTTEQAVKVLENGNIRSLFRQAMQAAVNRSREIADLFGKKA
ncbi:MAG: pyrroline-5-carboxylate reductase [Gammaproteobacteria bacterium]|nr:pyrroline-5-carboxylate reductase [Gammaproteobacteria bacterium]MDH3405682.1 pyrroline-5-carboxylate reductase [Gammaproteobacteria bacterium]MDH3563707.1 pyrroline-5-carboxylate reductase [Gammaproteobacteria bacterium]MDH5486237.1 pyrroline-5-carboxylate reductase [Gammaproteobacteria bacterium]